MSSSVLFDTNILVYSTGVDDAARAATARAALRAIEPTESGTISTQVLSEYASVMLRRYPSSGRAVVLRELAALREAWPVVLVTEDTLEEAVRGVLEHGMSFYGAQIWATARLNGIDVVLTEDCPDGRVIEGVRFVDPFSPDFDLEALLA